MARGYSSENFNPFTWPIYMRLIRRTTFRRLSLGWMVFDRFFTSEIDDGYGKNVMPSPSHQITKKIRNLTKKALGNHNTINQIFKYHFQLFSK